MTYNDLITLIQTVANAANPTGSFYHGRTYDTSLKFDGTYPQIHLYPFNQNLVAGNENIVRSTMLIGFWKEDDHSNNMVERQNIINDMMQLSILFESGLRQQTVFIESLRREPQYLVQMGVVSGVAMEVVIQSSVGCDTPLVVCEPAIITLNGDSFLTVNSGAGANIRLVDENGDEVEPESVTGSVIELPPIGGGDATVTLMGDAFLTIPAGDSENILIQDASDSNIEPSSVTGNVIKYNINIKPSFSVAPVLSASGNQNVGTVITCGNGTVLGVPTITYTYQWKRDGVNFVNANNTYTLLVGDVGSVITCSVTATNGFGFDSELTSNSVTVVAASNYLLDVVSGGRVAYGLIKLRSAYSGNCIRVRRASDNAESNIGFVNDELDVTTLQTFCTGTNGFVTTFYDQTGNGENLVQASASNQPQIVNSGSVITTTGVGVGAVARPAIQWNNDFMYRLFTAPIVQPATLTLVHKLEGGDAIGDNWIMGYLAPNLRFLAPTFALQNINNTDSSIQYWMLNGASSTIKRNAAASATINSGTNSATDLYFGAGAGLGGQIGYSQCLVIWDGNKDSSITDIFDILNDYYKTS